MNDRTEYHRAWRAANPKKVAATHARYAERHPDRILAHVRDQNEKRKGYRAAWYLDNKERVQEMSRARNLERKYGITHEEWETLFGEQGEVCAICGAEESGGFGWATDHCHSTERLRGILCNRCNLAIGLMGDNPLVMLAAAAYLGGTELDESGTCGVVIEDGQVAS